MSFLKFLKSNLGFSMVEVTLAVGILGIGGVALMTLTQNTAKDSRSVDLTTIRSQYYHSLKEFFHSRRACDLLKSHTLELDLTPLNLQSDLLPIIKREKYFELKSIKARLIPEGQLTVTSGAEASVEIAVSIGPSQSSTSGTGSTSISSSLETFYFLIPVIMDGTNKIKYCDIEKSKELACHSLESGTIDVNGVCKIKENCKLTGGFSIVCGDPLASPSPNPLTGSSSCPPGSVSKKTGEMLVKHKDPPSKKGSSPNELATIYFYLCLECNPGTVTGDPATCPGGGGGGGGGWFGGGSGTAP